jgi:hypothetical protein
LKEALNVDDVWEWLRIADDDFDSAKILNGSARKHHEIICVRRPLKST